MRAEAPEFIPLGAIKKGPTLRRSFNEVFEQKLTIETEVSFPPIISDAIPPWLRDIYDIDLSRLR